MKLYAGLLALGLTLAPSLANATYCYGEQVNYVIWYGSAIYFTTNKSCPSWCQVDSTQASDVQDRAYSMLLSAKLSGNTLVIDWPQVTTSCAVVPGLSVPDIIIL